MNENILDRSYNVALPVEIHAEAEAITQKLIVITSAIDKLYTLKSELTNRLGKLSEGLSAEDSIKAALPLIKEIGATEWKTPVY